MNDFFCYIDAVSDEVLLGSLQKVLLIGSDFGYGNFGDIMEHKNVLQYYKQLERFLTVSIVDAKILDFVNNPAWLRKIYGADAVIFVSKEPLELGAFSSRIYLLKQARNIAAINLYGSSLNERLGSYVIKVAEYFLSLSHSSSYFITGQHIPQRFQKLLSSHLQDYTPLLLGIRNKESAERLLDLGIEANFSFDDATEALQQLGNSLNVCKGRGALLHLNISSGYRNNDLLGNFKSKLSMFKESHWGQAEIIYLQASCDPRSSVCDTRESIKLLDYSLPFRDCRLLELAALACYELSSIELNRPIAADIGFSCSYHVALFLELAGIPCWLHQVNAEYPKIEGDYSTRYDFNEFLNEPIAISYERHLEGRREWLALLDSVLLSIPDSSSLVTFSNYCNPFSSQVLASSAEYVAKPPDQLDFQVDMDDNSRDSALQRRLNYAENQIEDLLTRLEGLNQQLTEVGSQARAHKVKADKAARKLKDKSRTLREVEQKFKTLSQMHKIFDEHLDSCGLFCRQPPVNNAVSDNALISRLGDRFWNLQQRIQVIVSKLSKESLKK